MRKRDADPLFLSELFGVADNNGYGLKVYAFLKLAGVPFTHRARVRRLGGAARAVALHRR